MPMPATVCYSCGKPVTLHDPLPAVRGYREGVTDWHVLCLGCFTACKLAFTTCMHELRAQRGVRV